MSFRRIFSLFAAAVVLVSCQVDTRPESQALPPVFTPKLTEGNWQAGVAQGPLFTPFGLSMGGFGFRIGAPSERADKLGASQGRYQTLLVKAAAVSNGHGLVVFVKLPMIFPTDLLRRRVVALLGERTGLDFNDALILNATHTHSGPARFWALPEGLGLFGMDEFDPAVLDGLADSIAAVVQDAWANLAPARIGATEVLRFDPDHRISRDRRGNNDNLYTNLDDPNVYEQDGVFKSKDHRMWIMRIEDGQGIPLAAIVRFGIHGIVFSDQMYSEDAPGNIERAVERLWNVPLAMFLQGNAGDVSPAGGDHDRGGTQQAEAVALRTARAGLTAWRNIDTTDAGVFAIAHRRRKINRETLGYAPDEYGEGSGDYFQPYTWGAFQCGEVIDVDGVDSGNPETRLEDGRLGCLAIDDIQGALTPPEQVELPVGELAAAVMSAVRLGDWTLVTFPGEPVSQMGTQMRSAAASLGIENLAILGYSQTHLFYLTPEEDWFQGGYEAVMNIWGWRLGDYIIDENRSLLARLADYGSEPLWDGDPLVPLARETETRVAEIAEAVNPPRWLSLDGSSVTRFSQIAGRWVGGDSWIDPAQIVLVNAAGDLVEDSGGWGWRVDAVDGGDSGVYQVVFEPGLDIPVGTYHFRARGQALQRGETVPYEVRSSAFQIEGGPLLSATGTVTAGVLQLTPKLHANPIENEAIVADALDRRQLTGLRLVTDTVGPDDAAPLWQGTVTATAMAQPSATPVAISASYDAACQCFATPVSLPGGTNSLAIAAGALFWGDDYNTEPFSVEVP